MSRDFYFLCQSLKKKNLSVICMSKVAQLQKLCFLKWIFKNCMLKLLYPYFKLVGFRSGTPWEFEAIKIVSAFELLNRCQIYNNRWQHHM